MPSSRRLKVAVVCSGLGRVVRGYERFALDIATNLRSAVEIHLYGARRIRKLSIQNVSIHGIPSVGRNVFDQIPLIRSRPYRSSHYWEAATFMAGAVRSLTKERYDLIHVMDPPVLNLLHHVRQVSGLSSPILFTNGVSLPINYCDRADHLHQVSATAFDEAQAMGADDRRMTLIPYPTDAKALASTVIMTRHQARTELALPLDIPMVLSVAALNRSHKRMDYVIEEVARLRDAALLVVGEVEDETLLRLGSDLLGDRFFHRKLKFEDVGLAYRAADIFVLASLVEGFGMSLVEAMMMGLPVLAHTSDHFQWLVGDTRALVAMDRQGALADALTSTFQAQMLDGILEARRESAVGRFSWNVLAPAYLEMYRQAVQDGRNVPAANPRLAAS